MNSVNSPSSDLDDSTNSDDNDDLKSSFPDNSSGNKIDSLNKTDSSPVTTTRYGRKVVSVVPNIYDKFKRKNEIDKEDTNDKDDSDADTSESVEQPPMLFENEVMGTKVFGFRTPKSKAGMIELVNSMKKTHLISDKDLNDSDDTDDNEDKLQNVKASNKKHLPSSPNKSGTPKRGTPHKKNSIPHKNNSTPLKQNTPGKSSKGQNTPSNDGNGGMEPKTPYSLRARAKLNMVHEEEDDMFALTESEYDPSDSSSSESEPDNTTQHLPEPVEPQNVRSVRRRLPGRKSEFVLASSDYFGRRSGRKATSNNTLSSAGPRMNSSQVNSLLSSYTPSHQSAIKIMNKNITVFFRRWLFSLNMGYNVVVYGVGSKKSLLYKFYQQYLSSSFVLVVNGFFPGLTLKEIESNFRELLSLKGGECGDALCSQIAKCRKQIFLLVHNIDGESLRSDRMQTFFSNLAGLSNIHLIASIDHINAPLLWDQKKLSKFNFVWEDGTTFIPYEEETSFESSLMIQGTGNMALAALKNVMKSLTNNQQKIFNILMDYHIDSSGRGQGMSFSSLYHACRADFIVSSDLALRTLLTEFLDHELVKWKKETDMLSVTLDVATLKMYKSELLEEED